mmetsp:Transcript_133190/g.230961  ORF Transcript_133190/g.230961 Transcript_133190/m.230961 type:complete len:244 (-) Transcript_133190:1237-1968(-)
MLWCVFTMFFSTVFRWLCCPSRPVRVRSFFLVRIPSSRSRGLFGGVWPRCRSLKISLASNISVVSLAFFLAFFPSSTSVSGMMVSRTRSGSGLGPKTYSTPTTAGTMGMIISMNSHHSDVLLPGSGSGGTTSILNRTRQLPGEKVPVSMLKLQVASGQLSIFQSASSNQTQAMGSGAVKMARMRSKDSLAGWTSSTDTVEPLLHVTHPVNRTGFKSVWMLCKTIEAPSQTVTAPLTTLENAPL